MMLRNAGIAARVGIGFGIIILFIIFVSAFARIKMGTLADLTTEFYDHPFTVSTNLQGAEADIISMQKGIRDVFMARDEAELNMRLKEIDEAERDALDHLEIVHERYLGDKKEVDAIIDDLNVWKSHRESIFALVRANKKEEAIEFHRGKASQHVSRIMEKMAAVQSFAFKKAESFMDGARDTANATYSLIYAVVIAAVAVSAVIAFSISRPITRSLNMVVDSANSIAGGDLDVTLPSYERRDEIGALTKTFSAMTLYLREIAAVADRIAAGDLVAEVKPQSQKDVLGNALSAMTSNLRTMTMEIQESVQILVSSGGEILSTTTAVAEGTTETAAAVRETTATVEEVKQTAQVSSEKTKNVLESAQRAVLVARQGSAAVAENVDGMNRINALMGSVAESIVKLSEQTQAIGEIITTVNDLAQQSNLLSVNAAIEASKAGEQGKGFTVVAQEIRNLADQSKQATEQVRTILADIQKATTAAVMSAEQVGKAVEGGVKQAHESGEAIKRLAESIGDAENAAILIAASSRQQLAGMEQIALAMENINRSSEQNMAGTNQAEQAAHNLNELGRKLKDMVGKYRV